MARPVPSKTSVTMAAAGTPTFSKRIPSSPPPDGQDPQSPMPRPPTPPPPARPGGAVLPDQDVADLLEKTVGVDLRVLAEADAPALDGLGARHVGEGLLPGVNGRIGDPEGCPPP